MSPIPAFNLNGLLPPFAGATPVDLAQCAPYAAGVLEFATAFGTSARRCEILTGFLRYRLDLRAHGIVAGWQWIDGSFCQRLAAGTEPGDIDLITFMAADSPTVTALNASGLVDPAALKATYHCDGYYVNFNNGPVVAVKMTTYWYGLFAHSRTSLEWKGMVTVTLDAAEDEAASELIAARQEEFNA